LARVPDAQHPAGRATDGLARNVLARLADRVGGVRLVEIGYWHFAAKDMPQRGVTGGEWVLILVSC